MNVDTTAADGPSSRAWPRPTLASAAGGVLVALSLPPWGWWPLGCVGLALLVHAIDGVPASSRWWRGLTFGLGQFIVGLWWMGEFTPGAALAVAIEAPFVAVAAAATPRRAVVAFPAALVLAEWARGEVPFGGLPLAGLALGQVDGPLGQLARLAGALLVVGALGIAAVVVSRLARREWVPGAVGAAAVIVLTATANVAPDGGRAVGQIDVAAVQGGGPRGFRATETDPDDVVERHERISRGIRPGAADLVVWPEDVFDLPAPVDETPVADLLAAEARRLRATLVAGVVEDDGERRFRNRAAVWGPRGQRLGTYEKHHPVPFGEYVPMRSLIDRVADLSPIPRDARRGRGPNALDTPAGRLGIVISYEVFFSDRALDAARRDAEVLLVPTNAASFATSQVPTQEVAAAQLRAIEIGRDVVQAAPTGYTAIIDHRGRVARRSTLGRAEIVAGTVERRRGSTPYTRTGDGPLLAIALAGLVAAWVVDGRIRRRGT